MFRSPFLYAIIMAAIIGTLMQSPGADALPFLTKTKTYTPLLFFKVPKGTMDECKFYLMWIVYLVDVCFLVWLGAIIIWFGAVWILGLRVRMRSHIVYRIHPYVHADGHDWADVVNIMLIFVWWYQVFHNAGGGVAMHSSVEQHHLCVLDVYLKWNWSILLSSNHWEHIYSFPFVSSLFLIHPHFYRYSYYSIINN